jgi:hypothetical protein
MYTILLANDLTIVHLSLFYIKYIINVTTIITTVINTGKQIFEFYQREVISFFTLVTNKGEHSIIVMNARESENYLPISRSSNASK